MSDPITRVLLEYDKHLRAGGEPATPTESDTYHGHRTKKFLHPSQLALCDRRAAYDVMESTGEIETDTPRPESLYLDFRVGNIFEDFIAEALDWAGALVEWQPAYTDGIWRGRGDLLVDASKLGQDDELWLVEVKTVKNGDTKKLKTRYPYLYQLAQVWQYTRLSDREVRPMIFLALRPTMGTALYTFELDENDAQLFRWNGTGFKRSRRVKHFVPDVLESVAAQEKWHRDGTLPRRIGGSPTDHWFMCVSRSDGVATPSCQYFERCWGRPNKPFKVGGKKKIWNTGTN